MLLFNLYIFARTILSFFILFLILEGSLRFYRFRRAPLRLRFLYAFFLLSSEAEQAVYEIAQRVERTGVRGFDELFEYYAIASGKSKEVIETLFGFQMSWRNLLSSKLVLDNRFKLHIGLMPKPDQKLRTVSIDKNGRREVETGNENSEKPNIKKRVVLTGGSVAFGYGATSNKGTIAGGLQKYLNDMHAGGADWEVENWAFSGATSFQELILVLQNMTGSNRPEYLISVSGWNDVDQQFPTNSKNVSAISQGYADYLQQNNGLLNQLLRSFRKHSQLVVVVQRFIMGYRNWKQDDLSLDLLTHEQNSSERGDVDNPNIYPLF